MVFALICSLIHSTTGGSPRQWNNPMALRGFRAYEAQMAALAGQVRLPGLLRAVSTSTPLVLTGDRTFGTGDY